jgi:hypothetical protein
MNAHSLARVPTVGVDIDERITFQSSDARHLALMPVDLDAVEV